MLDWMHGHSRLPLALSVVELLVDMDCQGCETKVRRAISKLSGVNTVEIDVDRQKVTVTGYIDREEVLRIVKRTGRAAEFWPFPYDGYYGDYYTYPSQYLEQSNQKINNHGENTISYGGNYNFYEDSSINGYYRRSPQKVDENDIHLFSDDNVHACVVM
ncbi:unnamed protein product [Brassica rapa]|uniref:HMA domain-containing protein n=1 Tax=Brassica campestris TaxID=3711 RepID=A0A3P6CC96_BRACM|nr:unnamed protein product [Brassica rapa]VDD10664.1 unnamed protein product [Brassica rapa]